VPHGDLGPWDTVYRDGSPVAFIDWDAAQPIEPLVDVAMAAWSFVPLARPDQLREAGFNPLPDLPRRLRLFVDASGLPDPAGPAAGHAHSRRADQYAPIAPAEAAATLLDPQQETRRNPPETRCGSPRWRGVVSGWGGGGGRRG
jgi:aminoglycoside phosphotransferase (APT) family kinase protein